VKALILLGTSPGIVPEFLKGMKKKNKKIDEIYIVTSDNPQTISTAKQAEMIPSVS